MFDNRQSEKNDRMTLLVVDDNNIAYVATPSNFWTVADGNVQGIDCAESNDLMVYSGKSWVSPSSLYLPKPPIDLLDTLRNDLHSGGLLYVSNDATIHTVQFTDPANASNLNVFNNDRLVPYMSIPNRLIFDNVATITNNANYTPTMTFTFNANFASGCYLLTFAQQLEAINESGTNVVREQTSVNTTIRYGSSNLQIIYTTVPLNGQYLFNLAIMINLPQPLSSLTFTTTFRSGWSADRQCDPSQSTCHARVEMIEMRYEPY